MNSHLSSWKNRRFWAAFAFSFQPAFPETHKSHSLVLGQAMKKELLGLGNPLNSENFHYVDTNIQLHILCE